MSLSEDVNDALKNGRIHPALAEEYRFLPDTHPASAEFISTMERVHDRLLEGMLGKGYDRAANEVRFVLSADKEPNAFIMTGMLGLCDDESELAGVLDHELTHDFFRKRLGVSVQRPQGGAASGCRAHRTSRRGSVFRKSLERRCEADERILAASGRSEAESDVRCLGRYSYCGGRIIARIALRRAGERYRRQDRRYYFGRPLAPIGRLADLNDAIGEFIGATTPEKIGASARRLNALAKECSFDDKTDVGRELLGKIVFRRFDVPENAEALAKASLSNPLTMAWDRRVRHAVATQDAEVLKALKRLGGAAVGAVLATSGIAYLLHRHRVNRSPTEPDQAWAAKTASTGDTQRSV